MNQQTISVAAFKCVIALSVLGVCSNIKAQNCDGCQNAQSISAPAMVRVLHGGPGTEMTKMINRMGIGSDCGRCKALANQMDQGGPEWVRQNRQYVVQSTISNASNLGYRMGPGKRLGVRMLVQRSIQKSTFGIR